MTITEIVQDTNFVESNALLTLNLAYDDRGAPVSYTEHLVLEYLIEHCTPRELDVLEEAASALHRLCAEAKFQQATRPKEG
jgi:hypothetical protein